MNALIDTNILIYRYDYRFPGKQEIATGILRRGIVDGSLRLPHQAIIEFVAAATRAIRWPRYPGAGGGAARSGRVAEAVCGSLPQ